MGHGNSDRLYVTRDEMSGIYGDHTAGGGRRTKASDAGFERLPFDCCALSLQPWSIPVCSATEGTIFELTNIIPFLKKYGASPATGTKLEAKDLLRLNFAKNAKGKYHDPVSFKEFNEHSHIVAIRTSGNVFTYDTVQQLNVKAKHWHDLVDDTAFTKKDLITLQDPHNIEDRNINNMHHIKSALKWTKDGTDTEEVNAKATGSASRLLAQLKAKESGDPASTSIAASTSNASDATPKVGESSRLPEATQDKKRTATNVSKTTNGMMAASFTSSGLDVRTTNERQMINEEEYMFEQVAAGHGLAKGKASKRIKAYVRIETNFGPLDMELHVDKAPKTCYNFLQLCKAHAYDDTAFHRLIPGFMIQGGDPTGTGRGGSSTWGEPFRDEFSTPGAYRHAYRGTLSMANRGPNTNGSQWFIAFRKLPHLDTKHTVFGQLVEADAAAKDGTQSQSLATLEKMEGVPVEPTTDRPLRSVRILKIYVLEDPFSEWKALQERREARENLSAEEVQAKEARRRKREEDRTTWLGTQLENTKGNGDGANRIGANVDLKGRAAVGRYLAGNGQKRTPDATIAASVPKKTKTEGGLATLPRGNQTMYY